MANNLRTKERISTCLRPLSSVLFKGGPCARRPLQSILLSKQPYTPAPGNQHLAPKHAIRGLFFGKQGLGKTNSGNKKTLLSTNIFTTCECCVTIHRCVKTRTRGAPSANGSTLEMDTNINRNKNFAMAFINSVKLSNNCGFRCRIFFFYIFVEILWATSWEICFVVMIVLNVCMNAAEAT